MRVFYKLAVPPAGYTRTMRAYMQAVLEATGLLVGECFDISLFMRNYRTHLGSGCLLRHSSGKYSLSEEGRRYFTSRLTEEPAVKGQRVSRAEVVEMLSKITADQPAPGWVAIG